MSLSPEEQARASEALQAAAIWSHEIDKRIAGPLGITTLSEDADPVHIIQGQKLLYRIPQKLYRRMRKYNQALTGESYLSPVVFNRIVNHALWWEYRKSPIDGGGVGFTIRALDFDTIQSYQEGVEAAKQKTDQIQCSS